MKNFLIHLSILTSILLGLSFATVFFLLKQDYPPILFFVFAYFYLITAYTHHTLLKAKDKRPQQFVASFMGITGLKLFISLGVVVGISLLFREHVLVLSLNFLALYLAFTFFEVRTINIELRKDGLAHQKENSKPSEK